MAALSARDRLFRHANTAQTDSAIVPDFQREICVVRMYRSIAISVSPAVASAVEACRYRQSAPPATHSPSIAGVSHAASLPADCFK